MKIVVIQPPYAHTADQAGQTVNFIIEALRGCGDDVDLIMLPEYCNAPGAYASPDAFLADVDRFTAPVLDAVVVAARRGALVGVNLAHRVGGKLRNATLLFDRRGEQVAVYYKRHLAPSELALKCLDDEYTFELGTPPVVEVDGVRFGFLTCYDFYFTEYIAHLAAQKPDIILGASYQRAERQDMIESMSKLCAFNCNAYLVRASVSMGAESKTGGCSMLVAPDGNILANFGQATGALVGEIDPKFKYMRANGFGQPAIRNDQYIENGRKPWAYRDAGRFVRPARCESNMQ